MQTTLRVVLDTSMVLAAKRSQYAVQRLGFA
jgi:hypothetical protein